MERMSSATSADLSQFTGKLIYHQHSQANIRHQLKMPILCVRNR